ncbi:hypothetical protein ACS8GI_004350, partial [Vibrio vulnificus]
NQNQKCHRLAVRLQLIVSRAPYLLAATKIPNEATEHHCLVMNETDSCETENKPQNLIGKEETRR